MNPIVKGVSLFLLYFPELKVISWALQARSYRKDCERKTEQLRGRLKGGLEEVLRDVRKDIFKQNPADLVEKCQKVDAIRKDVYHFATYDLSTVDLYEKRKTKERKEYCKRRAEVVEKIGQYVEPAEQALTELRNTNSVNVRELDAVQGYLKVLKDAYKQSKQKNVELEGKLKEFESKHPFTKVTKYSEKQRNKVKVVEDPKNKAEAYISEVYTRLSNNPPEYHPYPKGQILTNNGGWKVKPPAWGKVVGDHSEIPLRISCEYVGNGNITSKQLRRRSNRARSRFERWDRYDVVCFVGNGKSEKIVDTIMSHRYPNLCPLYYSLGSKELIYNPAERNAEIFAGYFDTSKRPPSMDAILEAEQNKSGKITLDYLTNTLKLDEVERKKLRRVIFPAGHQEYVLTRTKLYGGEKNV